MVMLTRIRRLISAAIYANVPGIIRLITPINTVVVNISPSIIVLAAMAIKTRKNSSHLHRPMGKMVNTLEGGGTEITNRPELEHENGTKVNRGINSVSIVDGNNEMFHKCLQTRQKRHAVVVCIIAGVGSVAVAL